jgi:hypothetical protein
MIATLLEFILLPIILIVLAGWVAHWIVESFLDDLGGPGDGPGYT